MGGCPCPGPPWLCLSPWLWVLGVQPRCAAAAGRPSQIPLGLRGHRHAQGHTARRLYCALGAGGEGASSAFHLATASELASPPPARPRAAGAGLHLRSQVCVCQSALGLGLC